MLGGTKEERTAGLTLRFRISTDTYSLEYFKMAVPTLRAMSPSATDAATQICRNTITTRELARAVQDYEQTPNTHAVLFMLLQALEEDGMDGIQITGKHRTSICGNTRRDYDETQGACCALQASYGLQARSLP